MKSMKLLEGLWTQFLHHLRKHFLLLSHRQTLHDHGEADAIRIEQLLLIGCGRVDQRLREVIPYVLLLKVWIIEMMEYLIVLENVDDSLRRQVLVLFRRLPLRPLLPHFFILLVVRCVVVLSSYLLLLLRLIFDRWFHIFEISFM